MYTVGEALEDYLAWLSTARKSAAEVARVARRDVLPVFGHRTIASLTSGELRAWHEALAKATSPATANRKLTVLKAALNRAWSHERAHDQSSWHRVKAFAGADRPVTRWLRPDEARALADTCAPDFRALVLAALFTGGRYGELTQLEARDVMTDAVHFQHTKSGRPRFVPLNAEARAHFAALARNRVGLVLLRSSGNPWKKQDQRWRMAWACKRARIEPAARFHDLRHTYASWLAQDGVPLQAIAALLGHADTRMTERHYAHLRSDYLARLVDTHMPTIAL